MNSFEDSCLTCSNDDLGLTLTLFCGKVKFVFPAFIWEEFIENVDLGAKVNECS